MNILVVIKVTIYPVMRAATTVPSRIPSIFPAIAHDNAAAPITSATSNNTFVVPNVFPNLNEVYLTKPSALIMATLGLISRETPTPCIKHPKTNTDKAIEYDVI